MFIKHIMNYQNYIFVYLLTHINCRSSFMHECYIVPSINLFKSYISNMFLRFGRFRFRFSKNILERYFLYSSVIFIQLFKCPITVHYVLYRYFLGFHYYIQYVSVVISTMKQMWANVSVHSLFETEMRR